MGRGRCQWWVREYYLLVQGTVARDENVIMHSEHQRNYTSAVPVINGRKGISSCATSSHPMIVSFRSRDDEEEHVGRRDLKKMACLGICRQEPLFTTMSILQLFRHQHPARGPGLAVGSRFRELCEKPGYLSLEDGSLELRKFYVDGLSSSSVYFIFGIPFL